MITNRQKEECLNDLKQAYSAMHLYMELKEDSQAKKNFNQTAFDLCAAALQTIAETYELPSEVRNHRITQQERNKKLYAEIEKLENEMDNQLAIATLPNQMKTLCYRIKKRWLQQGFHAPSDISISREKVVIKLNVRPLQESWELDLHIEDENEWDRLFDSYHQQFCSHDFTLHGEEDEEVYMVATTENEEKLIALIEQCFPGAEIYELSKHKRDNVFVLNPIEIKLSTVSTFDY